MKLCLQENKGLELLNIPISVSLLYEKEYEIMIQRQNKKRRSVTEKHISAHEKNKNKRINVLSAIKFM
jgi:hypothetical protein